MAYTSSFSESWASIPLPSSYTLLEEQILGWDDFDGEKHQQCGPNPMQDSDPLTQLMAYTDPQLDPQQQPPSLFFHAPTSDRFSPARQYTGPTSTVTADSSSVTDNSTLGLGTSQFLPQESSLHRQHHGSSANVPSSQLSGTDVVSPRSKNAGRPDTAAERRNSTVSRTSTLQCDWRGCDTHPTFNRAADLWRHIKHLHLSPASHVCWIDGCGRSFNRPDNLTEHALRVHGYRSTR
ncbi:hypothetical protein BO99DRAFT_137642 [Aspergillus violaceofuscus CBS 115571]|uniref:C2H2-type domain-containing protein n=1 Tax=Aspergillus violaceofuscus (strain CBS 115571) TaxID=1450538 RepID=A0A2V5H5X7_ASPV1|nr:hypothetical protein BO99DRAFT_137642 [Aspergillus violaceofuscus CBS 115571]